MRIIIWVYKVITFCQADHNHSHVEITCVCGFIFINIIRVITS